MDIIKIDMTLKYTKELNILYVEDNKELQTQTSEFFETLFKSVTIANNGLEALEKFNHIHYDLVITDIEMPKMDGVELAKEIKKTNAYQPIIVTSAYNDTKYLINFLNIGIKHFIQKPMKKENILQVLYAVAKGIKNDQMVESYRRELEAKNIELKNKNDELQILVRILNSKLTQTPKETTIKKDIDYTKSELSNNNLITLMELEEDISGTAVLINLSNNLDVSNIQILGKMFSSYADVLVPYKEYEILTTKIMQLRDSLNNAPQSFINRVEDVSILLESFIYVPKMWRVHITNKNIKKLLNFTLQ